MSGPFDGMDLGNIDLTSMSNADIGKLFAHVPEDKIAATVAKLREAAAKEQSNRAMLAEMVSIVSRVGDVALKVAGAG